MKPLPQRWCRIRDAKKKTFFLPSNKQILNLNNIHYIGARLQRRGFIVIHLKTIFRLGEA